MVDRLDMAAAERAIVSLVIYKDSLFKVAADSLVVSDITDINLQFLWKVCNKFSQHNKDWTWQIIADGCKHVENRPRELLQPITFISDLMSKVPGVEQLQFFIDILLERKVRNKLDKSIEDFKILLSDPTIKMSALYSGLRDLEGLFVGHSVQLTRNIGQHNLWDELKKDIQEIAETPFVGTGYSRIDRNLTWGFAPGQISVIAGRPSMGKSTFRANIQRRMCERNIHSITISLEQPAVDEYLRLISMQTGMSVQDMIIGFRKDHPEFDSDMFVAAIKDMVEGWPHRIVEPRGLFFLKDVKDVVEECRKDGENPKVVFIDLFNQLHDISRVYDPGKRAGLIYQKLLEAATMARVLQIHICTIVQLRRFGKDRGKIDRQEMYKESGGIEERVDLAFQVDRPGYHKPDEVEDNCIQIFIGKQRQGRRAQVIELAWNPHCLRIEDEGPEGSGVEEHESVMF